MAMAANAKIDFSLLVIEPYPDLAPLKVLAILGPRQWTVFRFRTPTRPYNTWNF
jgi:hypothetical protein